MSKIKLAYILVEHFCKGLGANKDFYDICDCAHVYVHKYIYATHEDMMSVFLSS